MVEAPSVTFASTARTPGWESDQGGNREPSKLHKALVNDKNNQEFARKLARKVGRSVPQNYHDDLESAAFRYLNKAAERFDPLRPKPELKPGDPEPNWFHVFAAKVIGRGLTDELSRIFKHLDGLTDPNSLSGCHVGGSRVLDLSEVSDNRRKPKPAYDADEVRQLHRYMKALPDDLRKIVKLYYLRGVSQPEIAILTGLSQPTISRRLAEALEIMKAVAASPGGKSDTDDTDDGDPGEVYEPQCGDVFIEEREGEFTAILHGLGGSRTVLATGPEQRVEQVARACVDKKMAPRKRFRFRE